MSTDDRQSLRQFIQDELPLIDAEFACMRGMDGVRIVLNAVTGKNVRGGDSISATSGIFLDALLDAKRKGTLALIVLPRAIKALAELKKAKQ